ncbi:MAG: hypothetical protein PF485_02405 [Bacteroidales bacterium]|jgi:hypothetical protein|nr:hypothetical protein [Bacteroidales bacterium]
MQPIKALLPVSIWLMRIGLLLYAYDEYFNTMTKFHLDDLHFYIAVLFLISAAIIFVTGFIYKATYTVLSGLVITLISAFNIIDNLEGGLDTTLIINIIIASLAIYFLSNPTSK